jgi:predicted PurR-regulated permease PerM
MDAQSNLLRITARVIIATFIVLVMIVGKTFLVPFAWAVMIAMAGYPMLDNLERKTKLPRSLINGLFLLALMVSLMGIALFFYKELSHIFRDMPALAATISERLHDLSLRLKDTGINLPENFDKAYFTDWAKNHSGIFVNILSGIGINIWNILLILFYMFFLLYYRDLVFTFFARKYNDPKRMVAVRSQFNQSLTIVRSYIFGLLVLTLVSAAMNYIVLLLFGLEFALFFAIFLAVLNLIPFIGNPLGLITIFIFAAITKDTLFTPLLIMAALFVANFLQDNMVRPWLMGDKMKLNAFAIFVSIIIGGMIWGVSGMILFIPITGIIKVILESSRETEHYAIFLSELPAKQKVKKEPAEKGSV